MQFGMTNGKLQTFDKGGKCYPDIRIENTWNDFGEMHDYYFNDTKTKPFEKPLPTKTQ